MYRRGVGGGCIVVDGFEFIMCLVSVDFFRDACGAALAAGFMGNR